MNDQITSNLPKYEWVLIGNCIGLKKGAIRKDISAADIVRFEYKDKKILKGIEVSSRPSEKLINLKQYLIKRKENFINILKKNLITSVYLSNIKIFRLVGCPIQF